MFESPSYKQLSKVGKLMSCIISINKAAGPREFTSEHRFFRVRLGKRRLK